MTKYLLPSELCDMRKSLNFEILVYVMLITFISYQVLDYITFFKKGLVVFLHTCDMILTGCWVKANVLAQLKFSVNNHMDLTV